MFTSKLVVSAPFEKYDRQVGSSPQVGMKIKKYLKPPPRLASSDFLFMTFQGSPFPFALWAPRCPAVTTNAFQNGEAKKKSGSATWKVHSKNQPGMISTHHNKKK